MNHTSESNPLTKDDNEGQRLLGNNQEQSSSRKKKIIAIVGGVIVAVAVIVVILVLVLKKSSGGDPPVDPGTGGNNPYNVQSYNLTGHGSQLFKLQRDTSISLSGNLAVGGNTFVENVGVQAQLLNYQTARIQVFNFDNQSEAYQVPSAFQGPNLYKDFQQGIFFNHLGFEFQPKGKFGWTIYDRDNRDREYVSTVDEPFVVMKYYTEIGFKIESQRLFGLGERTRNFALGEGTYTLFPQNNPGAVDDGQQGDSPKQQSGMHPFLITQLRNEDRGFFGIYFRSSNAQQVSLKFESKTVQDGDEKVTRNFTHVNFKSNGGLLDIFFFLGPTYQEVLRQYHTVIGKPALPPHFSHGLFLSNDNQYNSGANLKTLISGLNDTAFPYDGVVLSPDMVVYQHSFTLKDGKTVKDYRSLYPNTQFVFPFSPFVDKAQEDTVPKEILVSVGGTPLGVQFNGGKQGFCFDYFHPEAHSILEKTLTNAQFDPSYTGIWLYYSSPQIESSTATGAQDPYSQIPYLNDQNAIFKKTLPAYAEHTIGGDKANPIKQSHFYLHGVYGTQMTYVWQEFLRDPLKNTNQGFLVADSTFPGAGSRGVAHVYPKTTLSSDSLRYAAAQILNFNMFGIPMSGHNVCGYQRGDDGDTVTRQLCSRSYQLALVTPLAVFNSDSTKLLPYPDDGPTITNIKNALYARLALLNYQRTQLFRLSQIGGALNQPMFTVYPEDKSFTPDMVDTMMYGDALKVDFVFDANVDVKQVILPVGTYWYDIFNTEMIQAPSGTNVYNYKVRPDLPIVLQKAGTIIPFQDPQKDEKRGAKGLFLIPLKFLAVLDDQSTAKGHVLIEDKDQNREYYELKIENNMIAFKQQNDGQIPGNATNKQISMISLEGKMGTFPTTKVQACAIMNDHHTVVELDAQSTTQDGVSMTIAPLKGQTLMIDQVLFIVWGAQKSSIVCDQTLFQSKVIFNLTEPSSSTYRQEFIIQQNLTRLNGFISNMRVQVEVQLDNSVRLEWFPEASNVERDDSGFKRNIKKALTQHSLADVVTISYDPFYIEVHAVGDPKTIFFTTRGARNIYAHDFSMFSFFQPSTNSSRFFGIGERKGNFWLQDNYQYSLFTNNHDIADIKQAGGRTVQFSKNGFFPIIYSQNQMDTHGGTLNAVWLTEGSKDIFFTSAFKTQTGTIPKVSVVQTVNHVDLTVVFDQHPEGIFETLFNAEYKAGVSIPPTNALGYYHLVRGINNTNTLIDIWNTYSNKFNWPLEGFVLDLNFTGFQSLSFNQDYVDGKNVEHFLMYLNATNQTLIQIQKAGVPKHSNGAKNLSNSGAAVIKQPNYIMQGVALTGRDQGGDVIYANYFSKSSQALNTYVDNLYNYYENNNIYHKYGVQLLHNEPFDVYCVQDCVNDVVVDPQPNQFYKVGVDQQLRNSLTGSSIKNTDQHNGYGYKQQSYVRNHDSFQKKFYISSSNTPQSGRYGNVGRWIDYIHYEDDITVASQALQSLSLLGMGFVGEKFASINRDVANTLRDQHITLQTFSPLAAHQWKDPSDKNPDDMFAGALLRYKYMLLKYTQTSLYEMAAKGMPFIRPVWIQFYTDPKAYDDRTLHYQYMYGDTFMVTFQDQGVKAYYPKGSWCSIIYFNPIEDDGLCFTNKEGGVISRTNKFFFAYEHTITPLQDPEGIFHTTSPKVRNTHDLIDIPVDLHIVPKLFEDSDPTNNFLSATGSILFYSDESNILPHCHIDITLRNDTMRFDMSEGRDIQICAQYPGFKLGAIVIYNLLQNDFKFTQASINGNTDSANYITAKSIGKTGQYKFFDLTNTTLTGGLTSWAQLEIIKFM